MAGKKDNPRKGIWGIIKCFVRVDWPIGSPLKTEKVRLPACRKLIFSGWGCMRQQRGAGRGSGRGAAVEGFSFGGAVAGWPLLRIQPPSESVFLNRGGFK